jgi:hypothetical protein
MEKIILQNILNTLNIEVNEIAIPKWGKRPEVLFTCLIEAIIDQGSLKKASVHLGLAERSLDAYIKRHLMNRLPKKENTNSWDNNILSCIDYIKCGSCNGLFHKSNFIVSSTNHTCKTCKAIKAQIYYNDNTECIKAYKLEYYINNKKRVLQTCKTWRDANPEKISEYAANRRQQKNRGKIYTNGYESAERSKVLNFYKDRPKGVHVDHIVPLVNNLVCGLHVESNLQYLEPYDNLAKSNKFYIE